VFSCNTWLTEMIRNFRRSGHTNVTGEVMDLTAKQHKQSNSSTSPHTIALWGRSKGDKKFCARGRNRSVMKKLEREQQRSNFPTASFNLREVFVFLPLLAIESTPAASCFKLSPWTIQLQHITALRSTYEQQYSLTYTPWLHNFRLCASWACCMATVTPTFITCDCAKWTADALIWHTFFSSLKQPL